MKMRRGLRTQRYCLTHAHWEIYTDREYGVQVISILMQAENRPSIFPGEDRWPHGPEWVLEVWAPNLGADTLQPGTTVAIESDWDEVTGRVFTNFYYDQHDHTTRNRITVVSRAADAIRVKVEGRISAANASMPRTRIKAEATLIPGPSSFLGGFMRGRPAPQPPVGAVIRQRNGS